MGAATSAAIKALRPDQIGANQACGRLAIQGLLLESQQRGLRATTLDLRNSGDAAIAWWDMGRGCFGGR